MLDRNKPYTQHLPLFGPNKNMVRVRATLRNMTIRDHIADLVLEDLKLAGLYVDSVPTE